PPASSSAPAAKSNPSSRKKPIVTAPRQRGDNSVTKEIIEQGATVLSKLREDLRSSPVTDLVVTAQGFQGVAVVTRQHLEGQSIELMRDSELRVLGKVTRVLKDDGDRIDLLRRSVARHLSTAAAGQVYAFLRNSKFLNL